MAADGACTLPLVVSDLEHIRGTQIYAIPSLCNFLLQLIKAHSVKYIFYSSQLSCRYHNDHMQKEGDRAQGMSGLVNQRNPNQCLCPVVPDARASHFYMVKVP